MHSILNTEQFFLLCSFLHLPDVPKIYAIVSEFEIGCIFFFLIFWENMWPYSWKSDKTYSLKMYNHSQYQQKSIYFPKLIKSEGVNRDFFVCPEYWYPCLRDKIKCLRLSTTSWDHHTKQSPCQSTHQTLPAPAQAAALTHLPSLTHQPQYGSLAWAHFSQSEYSWQSCTGNRYTCKIKSKANITYEDGIRRWKHSWT